MSDSLVLTTVAVGLVWAVAGVSLLGVGGAWPSGVAAIVAGGSAVLGAVLDRAGDPDGTPYLTLAVLLWGPLAVIAYPRIGRRDRAVVAGATAVVVLTSVTVVVALDRAYDVPVAWALLPLAVIGSVWWRLEVTGDRTERRALLWAAVGLLVWTVLLFTAGFLSGDGGSAVGGTLAMVVPAVALVVGVRRPDVVDSRGLLVSAVVTGTALVVTLAVYVTVASLVEIVLDAQPTVGWQGILAAACAVGFQPLRRELHEMVDRLLFGGRPDPVVAAARLGGEVGDDPQAAVTAVRHGLVLPYVCLHRTVDGRPEVLAEDGDPTPYTRTFALPAAGDEGELTLVAGLRSGDLRFSDADLDVLRLALPLLALTVRAHQLSARLQEARTRSLAALEEERRRLRRDLHDGLGPLLSGVAFSIDAAANLVRTDPAAAQDVLAGVRREAGAALDDLRRLVYGMRPPALDELGLIGAIAQHAEGLAAGARRLQVVLDVPEPLPGLPAAVEVAALRIVVEATTNVARHTASPQATVRLRIQHDALRIEVRDSSATPQEWVAGVGMSSMRERAVELGGTFRAGATVEGGRVEAVLPVLPLAGAAVPSGISPR